MFSPVIPTGRPKTAAWYVALGYTKCRVANAVCGINRGQGTEHLTIRVKWPPNLATSAAAFCSLCTRARQGSKFKNPWPLSRRQILEGRFWIFLLTDRKPILKPHPVSRTKMASPSSPSPTSLGGISDPIYPISTAPPWQSSAPGPGQTRQNGTINRSRS